MGQMSPEYKRAWYIKNRDRIRVKNQERREHRKKVHADWRAKRSEYLKQYRAKYRQTNRARINENYRKWVKQNPDKANAYASSYMMRRRKNDIGFRIMHNLRSSLSRMLKRNSTSKRCSTVKLLGCSIKDFRIYIESQFQVGMSWENYGDWHIDHVMPCAIFDLSKMEHQKRCFHFSNMQPMWAHENHTKSDKILSDQFRLL